MIPTRLGRRALVAIALAVAAAAAPLASAPAHAASLVCGNAIGGQDSYTVTSFVTHGKKVTTTPATGEYKLGFSLDKPSCLGSTYAITVSSTDGSALGWSTVSTTPAATTSVSSSGASATVTFTGDGLNQSFALDGTTAQYTQLCINSSGLITNPDGTTQSGSSQPCYKTSGGTGYFH